MTKQPLYNNSKNYIFKIETDSNRWAQIRPNVDILELCKFKMLAAFFPYPSFQWKWKVFLYKENQTKNSRTNSRKEDYRSKYSSRKCHLSQWQVLGKNSTNYQATESFQNGKYVKTDSKGHFQDCKGQKSFKKLNIFFL